MEYIQRQQYLDFLTRWQEKDVIKVVSGVRRSGKSTLFAIFKQQLLQSGVEEKQIIQMNFEELKNFAYLDYLKLNEYLEAQLIPDQMNYIFLDEIQNVDKFQLVVDSLYVKANVDIYITGSNAYFMSSTFATVLSGRYVQMNILPLSFAEFASWYQHTDLVKTYNEYIKTSFPYRIHLPEEQITEYLEGIFNTILVRDIVQRLGKVDSSVIVAVIKYLLATVGSEVSLRNIANTLKSYGIETTPSSISKYITAIKESLLFYEVKPYQIKGKRLLSSPSKYYAVDMGLRYSLLPDFVGDTGHILENVIYLELRRRGYEVFVGKEGEVEVDFVAIKQKERLYIQVSLNTSDEATLKRELRSLADINDQYPKLLLTMDTLNPEANYDGIIKTSALQWLLDK